MTCTLEADLGGGNSVLTITVRGSECRIEDAHILIFGLLSEIRKSNAARDLKTTQTKPCGCNEAP